jgi:hypothetical protein
MKKLSAATDPLCHTLHLAKFSRVQPCNKTPPKKNRCTTVRGQLRSFRFIPPTLVVLEQARPLRPDRERGRRRRRRRDDVQPPREERRLGRGVRDVAAAARERPLAVAGHGAGRLLPGRPVLRGPLRGVAARAVMVHGRCRRRAPLLLLEPDAAGIAQGLHGTQRQKSCSWTRRPERVRVRRAYMEDCASFNRASKVSRDRDRHDARSCRAHVTGDVAMRFQYVTFTLTCS